MRWQPRMCSCCKTENGRHKKDNGSDTEPQSPTPHTPRKPLIPNFPISKSPGQQVPNPQSTLSSKFKIPISQVPNSAFPTFPNVASAPPKAPSPRFPKNAAGGKSPARGPCHRLVRTTAPFGTKQSAQAPCAWGLGASTSSRRYWLAALPPCRCAGSTLFALRAKALQSGAPDFGRVAGESSLRGGLPIRGTFPARRGTGPPARFAANILRPCGRDQLSAPAKAQLSSLPAAASFPRHPAGRTAGSARTRSRVQGRLSSKCNSLEEDIERRAPVETFAGPVVDQIKDALKLRL